MSIWAGSRRARVARSAAPSAARGRGERAADRARRLVDLATGQLEERQPGLGVVAVLVRSLECLGRRVQVAHPQPDLADLVLGVADGIQEPEALELLAGLARLLLGLGPQAAEHLELGAMDAADARVAAHGLATHPALALVRPLRRPLEIPDVPTGGDRVAVDVARDAEVELARRRGRRRLVDEREAGLPVAREDLRPCP